MMPCPLRHSMTVPPCREATSSGSLHSCRSNAWGHATHRMTLKGVQTTRGIQRLLKQSKCMLSVTNSGCACRHHQRVWYSSSLNAAAANLAGALYGASMKQQHSLWCTNICSSATYLLAGCLCLHEVTPWLQQALGCREQEPEAAPPVARLLTNADAG